MFNFHLPKVEIFCSDIQRVNFFCSLLVTLLHWSVIGTVHQFQHFYLDFQRSKCTIIIMLCIYFLMLTLQQCRPLKKPLNYCSSVFWQFYIIDTCMIPVNVCVLILYRYIAHISIWHHNTWQCGLDKFAALLY